MNVDVSIRFLFEVSQNEFKLIVTALRQFGGNGLNLAEELESARANHFDEIARRFSAFATSSEGTKDVTRKSKKEAL